MRSSMHGAEAVLPSKVKHGSPWVLAVNEDAQEDIHCDDLLLLQGLRHRASLRAARYQQALRRYHSRDIRPRTLEMGDLDLRRIFSRNGIHKPSPMWEGPYRVTRLAKPGSVPLETANGVLVKNPWNIEHLRKFYP